MYSVCRMAQPIPPEADATKQARRIDPEDPKWWRRFRRKADAERQVRVELAIYAKDPRFLYAGAPYEFPAEDVGTEGRNADAEGVPRGTLKDGVEGPREVMDERPCASSEAACQRLPPPFPTDSMAPSLQSPSPRAVEERQGPSPSQRPFSGSPEDHLPLMSIETYDSPFGDSPCVDNGVGKAVMKGAPENQRGLWEGPGHEGGLGGGNGGAVGTSKRDEASNGPSVIDREALMDDDCHAYIQSYFDETMRGLEQLKDGYRYKSMALASRILQRPQLLYYCAGPAGAALARPFDTQVAHYESGVRRALTKKGDLPPDAKVVGIHDIPMADIAALVLGHSAVQND